MHPSDSNAGLRVFVDESIHDRGGFIVVAAVCSTEDVEDEVVQALLDCGFDPRHDEFKSSMRMDNNPSAQHLRRHLQIILRSCKIAVAVCPISERANIVTHVASLLSKLDIPPETYVGTVFFDEGMTNTGAEMPTNAAPRFNCNSKSVAGIQLADCAAHLISTMLLNELGLISKMVAVSTEYEGEIELAWTLWATIRHALAGCTPAGQIDRYGEQEPMMKSFGLMVSESCSDKLKAAVEKRLGEVWIGCIH